MNYIPADKLIAEIERKISVCEKQRADAIEVECYDLAYDASARMGELNVVLETIASLQQEQPVVQNGKFVFPKYLYARTKDNKTIDMSYAPQDMTAVEYVRNDFVEQEQLDYKEAIQLVFEEELIPFKYGNQWCFLLGHNIQDGICGFGDTILDAAVAFYKGYTNTRIHIGELKISMDKKVHQEVDIEKELDQWRHKHFKGKRDGDYNGEYLERESQLDLARHFYELGLNARKEE